MCFQLGNTLPNTSEANEKIFECFFFFSFTSFISLVSTITVWSPSLLYCIHKLLAISIVVHSMLRSKTHKSAVSQCSFIYAISFSKYAYPLKKMNFKHVIFVSVLYVFRLSKFRIPSVYAQCNRYSSRMS